MFVKCVKRYKSYNDMTVGKIYSVIDVLKYSNTFVICYCILNDNGYKCVYGSCHFIDVTREIKLEKILNDVC